MQIIIDVRINTFQCWKKNTSYGKQMHNLKLILKTKQILHMNLKRFQHTFKLFTRCYFSLSAQFLQKLYVGLQRFDCKHGGRGQCLTLKFVNLTFHLSLFFYSFFFSFCLRSLLISLFTMPAYLVMMPCWLRPGRSKRKLTIR